MSGFNPGIISVFLVLGGVAYVAESLSILLFPELPPTKEVRLCRRKPNARRHSVHPTVGSYWAELLDKINIKMGNKTKGIPDNSSRIIPRLVCKDGAAEIDFCLTTFGAVELNRRMGPDNMMAHALLTIGNEMIMIEGEWPTLPSRAPNPDGSSPVVIFLYVADVDNTVEKAVANGATVLVQPQNQFWGDRIAWIMDPAGHVWTIATRIEETTAKERSDRWDTILKKKND